MPGKVGPHAASEALADLASPPDRVRRDEEVGGTGM